MIRVRLGRGATVLVAAVSALLLATTGIGAAQASPVVSPATVSTHGQAARHVVAYYQTQYVTASDGSQAYVLPIPLTGFATDIEVAAVHLNADGSLHLNDDPPSAAKFDPMWKDLRTLQGSGVRMIAMLGGAGVGSFANLHKDFDRYYPVLRDFLREYRFDGVDLDIEEHFSLRDTEHLIDRLHADFGSEFVITMSPVAADLAGKTTFSGGFDYARLEHAVGREIAWYNAQFYRGWGDLSDPTDYESVVANGFRPDRVVAGTVTNPANCGGYQQPDVLRGTLQALVAEYPSFGGVAGWEYFDSLGPVDNHPESWFRMVRDDLG